LGADASKRSTHALTDADRRAIRRAFDAARDSSSNSSSSSSSGHDATGSAGLASGGRVRASALWVVAPYDRAHGWLSSWGVGHGASAATAHAGWPTVSPTAAALPLQGGACPLGHGGGGALAGGGVACSGFGGPDDVAMARVVQTATSSLAHLHAWVSAAGQAAATAGAAAEEEEALNERASWEAAFTPRDPRHALGASVALRVCPKAVAAPDAFLSSGPGSSSSSSTLCVSGAALLAGHCNGPASSLLRAKPYKNAGASLPSAAGTGGAFAGAAGSGSGPGGSGSGPGGSAGPFRGVGAGARLVGLRPVELAVAELRARFGHLALFYTDAVGPASFAGGGPSSPSGHGPCVYVAWRAAWFAPKPFRVLESAYRRRVDPSGVPAGAAPALASRAKSRGAKGKNVTSDSESDSEDDPFSAEADEAEAGPARKSAAAAKAVSVGDAAALVEAMLACTSGVLDRARFL
jgi:hypothetical protein